jgi:hypothetical protein
MEEDPDILGRAEMPTEPESADVPQDLGYAKTQEEPNIPGRQSDGGSKGSRGRCKLFLDKILLGLDSIQEMDVLFNISIKLDKMKKRVPGISIQKRQFKRFSSLSPKQTRYKVAKVFESFKKSSYEKWIPILVLEQFKSVAENELGRYYTTSDNRLVRKQIQWNPPITYFKGP